MGRHKEIQSILLQELAADEERSKRSLQIINHQRHAIHTLEKELEDLKNTIAIKSREDAASVEDWNLILNQIFDLRKMLQGLKEVQDKITNEDQHKFESNVKINEIKIGVGFKGSAEESVTKPDSSRSNPSLVYLHKVNEQFEKKQEIINLKRKLETINERVAWLKKDRDEIMSYNKDQLIWRHRVENLLRDLNCGVVTGNGDSDNDKSLEFDGMTAQKSRNAWRTARKFFSVTQSQFLLSDS